MLTFAIRNAFLTLTVAVGLTIAGLWAWQQIPLDAIPDLSDNQVIVWADWPGKSPEDIDEQITSRLSRELQGLPGVRVVRGMSLYGTAYLYVIFEDGRDLYECRTRTMERLDQVRNLLPAGVVARLGPDATAMGQVYAFALEGPRDPEAKRYLLDQTILPALRAVPGVAEVAPAGGVVREYQIDVEPARLQELEITMEQLMGAVRAAGRDIGAMSVEQSGVETMIRGVGFLRSAAQIENIIVRGDSSRGAGLRLGQVANITIGGQLRQGLLADESGEQVGAIVALRVGEDPKKTIDAVKARLLSLAPVLAMDELRAVPYYDRSLLIRETNDTVTSTLQEAMVTTVLVVLLFLLHLRASLATAVSLPFGMMFAFLVMHLAGVSANIMSLAGIAIAIGVMVDFGIIMTENCTQHLVLLQEKCRAENRPMPSSPWNEEIIATIVDAAREIARPLFTSAATTVIGFLPIFALEDQAGRLFIPLAITKTLAISGAVLAGVFLVPVLCRFFLPPWEVRHRPLLIFAGLASGIVFGWYLRDGWSLTLDHGRILLAIPGWLFAPPMAALVGSAVWRLGNERLVEYEQNPTSHAIHVGYEWAYNHIIRHKAVFTSALLLLAGTGYLTGLGWPRLGAPLHALARLIGADLRQTRIDAALASWFPGAASSFLPPLDEGSLLFMPSLPATAGLGETQRVMMLQNKVIATIPEVAGIMGKMGRAESALDPAPIGMIESVVLLKPYAEWPVEERISANGRRVVRARTLQEVRESLAALSDLPGVAPSWLQPIETRVVMLSTGIRSLLALQIRGENPDDLERFAEAAEKILQQVPGTADAQMQREGGKPYTEIRLDPDRLARFGLSTEMVMDAVESAYGGMPITYTVEGALRYPVRIRYSRELRDDNDELGQLRIGMADGMGTIPLDSLLAKPTVYTLAFPVGGMSPARFLATLPLLHQRNFTILDDHHAEWTIPAGEPMPMEIIGHAGTPSPSIVSERPSDTGLTHVIGPMAVRSEDGKRVQYVMFNTVSGAGEMEVVAAAGKNLEQAISSGQLTLPKGTTYRWVGRYEQKIKADRTMAMVIALSLAIMVVLIFIGTRSWLITVVILLCNAIVTTAGGFFFVWLWDAQLTTAVTVGFLVLLGTMFNDGILLGTFLRDKFLIPPDDLNDVHNRVFEAGLRRRRPAFMTNATTLLSLLPVLWASGRGVDLMLPMVLPVIGGMLFDLVSLFSLPAFYTWYWEHKLARGSRARTGDAPDANPASI